MNVNFESIMRGLKSDIFDWDQVLNSFHICRIQLQKKKSGVKNVWKFVPFWLFEPVPYLLLLSYQTYSFCEYTPPQMSYNSFPNFEIVLIISLERSNASCWAERTSEWRRRTPLSSVSSMRAGSLIWTRAEVKTVNFKCWRKRWFLFRGYHHHHRFYDQRCPRSSEEQPAQVTH